MNFPKSYSPDHPHDNSSSLQDFSMGIEPQAVMMSNDQYSGAPLIDFENNFHHKATYASDHASMAAHKDSDSTCQNQKQKAMTHFILANMNSVDDGVVEHQKFRGGDSTLLGAHDKSQGSCNL